MAATRRDVLKGGLLAGAAAASPSFFPSRASAAGAVAIDPRGTTLERTVLHGPALVGRGGYRLLVSGPGEPHLVRTDLGTAAGRSRALARRAVIVFGQFTDMHICDAQSPARVEFLDRYNDGAGSSLVFDAAWRPQEALTPHQTAGMIRALNSLRYGPVTRRPIEFTVCTGDNIDNTQFNELRWLIDLMDGKTIRPDSGDPSKYEGVMDNDATSYDAHYWHPEGTPALHQDDNARKFYGFPKVPGLLDAMRRPFAAGGALKTPWYVAFGNHDPLMQGNVAPNAALEAIATGPLKIVGLPAGISPADFQNGLSAGDPTVLASLAAAPTRTVTADANRRPLARSEWMAEYFRTSTSPVGHGFSPANVDSGKGYYAYDHGASVRCIVLDTVNPGGYADGSLDAGQFAWLKSELAAASTVKLVGGSRIPVPGGRDKLVVIFSHHTVATMGNPVLAPGETQARIMGPAVATELLAWPNVVLWANGHSHRNQVFVHKRSGAAGGFWEVNTAAHIDYPHQSRVFEIVDNRDGTLSIFATMFDLDAQLSYGGQLGDPRSLAALGRELGFNDWQYRANPDPNAGRRGEPADRNVELLVAAPFRLSLLGPGASGSAVSGGETGRSDPATGGALADTGLDARLPALAVAAAGLAAYARRRLTRDDADVGLD